MNQGSTGLTSDQQALQKLASQQMATYWQTQMPGLSYGIKSTVGNAAGREERAAGAASASGRAAATQAGTEAESTLASRGILPGSGKFASTIGKIDTAGAGIAGMGGARSRLAEKGNTEATINNIIGTSQGIAGQATAALTGAAGDSAALARARAAAKAQGTQEVASGVTTAAMIASLFL